MKDTTADNDRPWLDCTYEGWKACFRDASRIHGLGWIAPMRDGKFQGAMGVPNI